MKLYPTKTRVGSCDSRSSAEFNRPLPSIVKVKKVPGIISISIGVHHVSNIDGSPAIIDHLEALLLVFRLENGVIDPIALGVLVGLPFHRNQNLKRSFEIEYASRDALQLLKLPALSFWRRNVDVSAACVVRIDGTGHFYGPPKALYNLSPLPIGLELENWGDNFKRPYRE